MVMEQMTMVLQCFDIIIQNKNLLLVFILGPLYFSYRGYFFIGTILGIIDYLIFYYAMNFFDILVIIFGGFEFAMIYFFINRLIYIVFSNFICVLIDKLKVKRIKKKYKENYKDKLKKYKHNKYYLLLTLLIYVILIYILIIIKRIPNGLL